MGNGASTAGQGTHTCVAFVRHNVTDCRRLPMTEQPRPPIPVLPANPPNAPDTQPRPGRPKRAAGWHTRDIMRAIALIFAFYVGLKLLWFAREIVLAVFLAILFGLAVSAGVDRLQRLRIPRGIGAAFIVLAFFVLLSGLGAWMAPTMREQG